MALTCHVCNVPRIVTAVSPSVSERRTIFSFSGLLLVQWKTVMNRYAPRKRLAGAGCYAQNHAVYASVSTRPAVLRAVAGNPRKFSPGAIGGTR